MSTLCALALLGSCAQRPLPAADLEGLLPTPLLLLGEQHDAADHQRLQRQTLAQLADQGLLAAVVLEMVERGRTTAGLPRDARETQVRDALDWNQDLNTGAWPWTVYGPLVMQAVRSGVPVLGGNLPRGQMRTAMGESGLDATLTAEALLQQRENIREGHCGLLPEAQVAPMTRIQIARDRAMAQTAREAIQPGQTVLLVAGHQHVRRDIGVPAHLPDQPLAVVVAQAGRASTDAANADRVWVTSPVSPKDHCAELKAQMGAR
ncbi:MAG: ChaN family lipoprotein [Hydrogenophaga sp.]